MARRLPFEGPRRKRRSRGAPARRRGRGVRPGHLDGAGQAVMPAVRRDADPSSREVRARLDTAVDHALDRHKLEDLLEEQQLAHDAMDASRVRRVREDMERAEARRLQPHYIESFFHEAFRRLGGTARPREAGRYQITYVPAPVRSRDRRIGLREPVLPRYERIAFEKPNVAPPGQPFAAFVCPGHPLLDAVIDLTLERHRDLLKRGTVLVDPRDAGTRPRVLFFPGACLAGREPDADRRPPCRFETHALRRARCGRRGPSSPLRAVPGLPAASPTSATRR